MVRLNETKCLSLVELNPCSFDTSPHVTSSQWWSINDGAKMRVMLLTSSGFLRDGNAVMFNFNPCNAELKCLS